MRIHFVIQIIILIGLGGCGACWCKKYVDLEETSNLRFPLGICYLDGKKIIFVNPSNSNDSLIFHNKKECIVKTNIIKREPIPCGNKSFINDSLILGNLSFRNDCYLKYSIFYANNEYIPHYLDSLKTNFNLYKEAFFITTSTKDTFWFANLADNNKDKYFFLVKFNYSNYGIYEFKKENN